MMIVLPCEGLLAELQLLLQMRQQLPHGLVTHTALHHVGDVMRTLHDLYPRLVNVLETLRFLYAGKTQPKTFQYPDNGQMIW